MGDITQLREAHEQISMAVRMADGGLDVDAQAEVARDALDDYLGEDE